MLTHQPSSFWGRWKWTIEAEALLRALTRGPRRADWVWIAKALSCSIGAAKAQYRMQHMEQLQRSSDQAKGAFLIRQWSSSSAVGAFGAVRGGHLVAPGWEPARLTSEQLRLHASC
jgi:hypothetical protein